MQQVDQYSRSINRTGQPTRQVNQQDRSAHQVFNRQYAFQCIYYKTGAPLYRHKRHPDALLSQAQQLKRLVC